MDTNLLAQPAVISTAEAHKQLAARTANLKIVSVDAFIEAAEWLKTIKANLKQIEDARTAMTRPINEGLRQINAQAASASKPYLESEAKIKAAILIYNQEQERIRREAQARADKAAADEQRRLQAVADKARAEAARKAQEQREAAARLEAEDAQKAAALRAAAARIEDNAEAKASQFEARAQTTVAAVIPMAEKPKVAGVGLRDNWSYRIKDKTKLNEAFKIADETKIGKTVKSLKMEALDVIGRDGIEIFNDQIVAAGRA